MPTLSLPALLALHLYKRKVSLAENQHQTNEQIMSAVPSLV